MKSSRAFILFVILASVLASRQWASAQGISKNDTELKAEVTPMVKGIYAEFTYAENEGAKQTPIVGVRVNNTNEFGFFGEKMPEDAREALPVMRKAFSEQLLYFRPTNLFCGPVELLDPSGKPVPCLKTGLISINDYPPSFSFGEAKKHNPHPPTIFPSPLIVTPDLLAKFPVADYFAIKQIGDYKLTVWPKIYERASTNDDMCKRIDLPAITMAISIKPSQVK